MLRTTTSSAKNRDREIKFGNFLAYLLPTILAKNIPLRQLALATSYSDFFFLSFKFDAQKLQ